MTPTNTSPSLFCSRDGALAIRSVPLPAPRAWYVPAAGSPTSRWQLGHRRFQWIRPWGAPIVDSLQEVLAPEDPPIPVYQETGGWR